jgi:hypothetical protein
MYWRYDMMLVSGFVYLYEMSDMDLETKAMDHGSYDHERRLRDFRRAHLLQRLVAYEARTKTIVRFTGYTRHELARLRRRWMIPQETRHRGPHPHSFEALLRAPRSRSEVAAIASIWRSVVGAAAGLSADLALERGERLSDIFEIFRACAPGSELDFEHLVMIDEGLARGEAIAFDQCTLCRCTIVVDRLATPRRICAHCQGTVGGEVRGRLMKDTAGSGV